MEEGRSPPQRGPRLVCALLRPGVFRARECFHFLGEQVQGSRCAVGGAAHFLHQCGLRRQVGPPPAAPPAAPPEGEGEGPGEETEPVPKAG